MSSEEASAERAALLEEVKQFGWALRYASDDLKNDREIVLAAVREWGGALEYASDDLKNDREFILAAVREYGTALEYAPVDLKNDREIVLAAVRQNGWALEYASDDLKNDREIVLAAVQQDATALKDTSDDLKNDREIVLAAVRQDGEALQVASAELKNDREIVLAAVQQNGRALEYASDDLKNDRKIVLGADRAALLEEVKQDGMALADASEHHRNDREIVLAAVQQNGGALEYTPDDLKNDREIVLAAVQQDGRALEYASDNLKNDREIVLAAVQQSGDAKDDRDTMAQNCGALEYASDDLKNDWEVVRAAVQNENFRFEHASDSLRNNRKVVQAVIEKDGMKGSVLCHVSTKFTFDDDLTELAVKFLRSEQGCATLFELIMDDGRAAQLGQFVRADPEVAECLNSKGVKAIGSAVKECREAMEKALRLFGDFDVDAGHLHFSRTACVLSATSHAEGAGGTARVALKGMRELEQVLAELKGRNGLDPNYVVAVLAVYADSSITDANKRKIKEAIPVYESASRTEPAVDVRYVEAEVERSLRPLLANRIVSASSSGGESIRRKTNSSPGSGYRFMLVLELGGRALSTALIHDRIAGVDVHTARKIAHDVVKSILHLHKQGRIHADIKPLNIVRIGLIWQILDLDVSCTIGSSFGIKAPSTGHCPPEMARLLLAVDEGSIASTEISSYTADTAYDLWSLGVLLYHLVIGRSLWNRDGNDDISTTDLRILAHAAKDNCDWNEHLDDGLFDLESRSSSPEKKAAADLLRKLLDPDPSARKKHFRGKLPMRAVLEEPFFQGKGVDDATLQNIAQRTEAAERYAKIAAENTVELIKMSQEHRNELITTRKVLLKGIFEATEVEMPSAFIVLEEPIPSEEEEKEMELLTLKKDGSGFELKGDAAKHVAKRAKDHFELGTKWLLRVADFAEAQGVANADPEKVFDSLKDPKKVFGSLKEMFEKLVKDKTLYFYLVDELTGKPVRDKAGIYPIKITTPSDVVPQLLPVLQVGMRAMSLYNGVAGIARMFGAPVPKVPKEWHKGAQESVELLKQKSSVEKFGVVHEEVISPDRRKKGKGGIRGDSYRELKKFFEKYSKRDDILYFSGLHRLGADDGTAVWTVLTGKKEVEDAIEKREEERLAEEGAHEEYVNNLRRERAPHPTGRENIGNRISLEPGPAANHAEANDTPTSGEIDPPTGEVRGCCGTGCLMLPIWSNRVRHDALTPIVGSASGEPCSPTLE